MNKSVFNKTDISNILNMNQNILTRFFVHSIALFGSYARDEQTQDSDIDFLVEFSKPVGLLHHANLIIELESLFGKKVDVVTPKALKPLLKDKILSELRAL